MVEKSRKSGKKSIFNPITLMTSLILIIGMILMSLVVIFLARDPQLNVNTPLELTKVSAFTPTSRIVSPTSTPSPTPTSIFFLPEGVIGVGAYVQVSGTEGAGLRMRADPGLGTAIKFTALDSEVFLVIDGPIEDDGYTWWHLEAPYDQTRNGWSAGDFLTPIEEED
jgi:hypothetical protein